MFDGYFQKISIMKVYSVEMIEEGKKEEVCLPNFRIKNSFLLKFHIWYCEVLGIHPFNSRNIKPFIGKIYTVILFGLLTVLSIWSGFTVNIQGSKVYSLFGRILNFTWALALVLLFVILLINSITKGDAWKKLEKNLSEFDDLFGKNIQKVERKGRKISIFIFFRLCELSFVLMDHMFWYWQNMQDFSVDSNVFLPVQIGFFYQTVISAVFREIIELLKSRYDFANEFLKVTIDNEISNTDFDHGIRKAKQIYKILFDCIGCVNDIFANVMFVFFVVMETVILSTVCLIVHKGIDQFKWEMYLEGTVFFLVSWVSNSYRYRSG